MSKLQQDVQRLIDSETGNAAKELNGFFIENLDDGERVLFRNKSSQNFSFRLLPLI